LPQLSLCVPLVVSFGVSEPRNKNPEPAVLIPIVAAVESQLL
jgi:hypothetical protein